MQLFWTQHSWGRGGGRGWWREQLYLEDEKTAASSLQQPTTSRDRRWKVESGKVRGGTGSLLELVVGRTPCPIVKQERCVKEHPLHKRLDLNDQFLSFSPLAAFLFIAQSCLYRSSSFNFLSPLCDLFSIFICFHFPPFFDYFCAIHPSSCLSSCSPKCFSLVCPTVSALSALVHSFLIIISSDAFCHGEPASPFQRGFPVTEQVSDGAEHTSTPSSTWCVAMVTAADKALPH